MHEFVGQDIYKTTLPSHALLSILYGINALDYQEPLVSVLKVLALLIRLLAVVVLSLMKNALYKIDQDTTKERRPCLEPVQR